MPVGQMGSVKYVLMSIPTTTASYIQVDFSVSARGATGELGLTSLLLPRKWLDCGVEGGRSFRPWQTGPTMRVFPDTKAFSLCLLST